MSAARRIAPRHRVLKSGLIILRKRASVINCTVRNLSSTGAAIWLPNAAALPPKFDLLFDNAIRRCIVVWRQADLMGVKFEAQQAKMLMKAELRRVAVAKLPELLAKADRD
jgi:PilZ domain